MEKYIEFEHITKLFPGQTALNDASFSIDQGEIHAIIGENGAGKSTLLNILHGVFPATEGIIRIDGEEVRFNNTSDGINFGIAKVHQEISSIPEMTVAENLYLGKEKTHWGLINHKEMNRNAQLLLEKLHCNFSAEDKMGRLSTGQKQMIAIAKAFLLNAKVISLDEPTASLSDVEVRILFDIIRGLKADGITIIYISHKLDEVFSMCDRATVLRDGKYINTFNIADISRNQIIHAMVGRDVSMFAKRTRCSLCQIDHVVLDVEHLSGANFNDVSFQLHKGEILGFFGLMGAGRTEVMRAIYGADKRFSGKVKLEGKLFQANSPHYSVKSGIALISENRKEEGIVPNLNNMDNIALPSLKSFQSGVFVKYHAKQLNATQLGKKVGLTPNDPEFMTTSLSGGNAQKVILARWISTNSDVIIFDEPTKGIDIGAKAEIYKLMEDMVESGKSIIMVSSELTEIMGMSDRILVMREGIITANLDKEEYSENKILKYAMEGA